MGHLSGTSVILATLERIQRRSTREVMGLFDLPYMVIHLFSAQGRLLPADLMHDVWKILVTVLLIPMLFSLPVLLV